MSMPEISKDTPFVLILLLYTICQESLASFNSIDNYLVELSYLTLNSNIQIFGCYLETQKYPLTTL